MKISNAISAKATGSQPRTDQSSDKQPTPTSADFALSGPSDLPDPRTHAYRPDLADLALAGKVIASHYAAPVDRRIGHPDILREGPSAESAEILSLKPGDLLAMLDDTLGWAWGYAGQDRLVGYVRSEALSPA